MLRWRMGDDFLQHPGFPEQVRVIPKKEMCLFLRLLKIF